MARRASTSKGGRRCNASAFDGILVVLTITAGAWLGLAGDRPIDRGVGEPVADVSLKDAAGKAVRLRDLAGEKATVVVFVATGCPVGDLYLPRLGELAREYGPKGVNFVAIDSSRGEEPRQVAEHMDRHGAAFPVLIDGGHAAADALMAERTCECLVIDAGHRLRYRGAIDDQYTRTAHKDRPARRHLAEALDAVLAGREVADKATPVSGCPIEVGEVATQTARIRRVRRTPPAGVEAAKVAEPTRRAIQDEMRKVGVLGIADGRQAIKGRAAGMPPNGGYGRTGSASWASRPAGWSRWAS